jgi:hypothetical protein
MVMDWLISRHAAHRARRAAQTFRYGVRRWATPLAPQVVAGLTKPVPPNVSQRWARDEINAGPLRAGCAPPPTSPTSSSVGRGQPRRAGTLPGSPCPPGPRQRLDVAALYRRWDAVNEHPHPLHALIEVALRRPRLASTSTSQEAVQLLSSHLRPLAKMVPNLEMAMVTGSMTRTDYADVGNLLADLADKWRALPDNQPDPPPRLLPPAS